MKKEVMSIIPWVIGIGLAVVLLYTLNPRGDEGHAAPTVATSAEGRAGPAVDDPGGDGASVLEMPTVVIVAPLRGVAEMQGASVASPVVPGSAR